MEMELDLEILRPDISVFNNPIKHRDKVFNICVPLENEIKEYRKIFTEPYKQEEEEIILSISYQLKLIGFSVPQWWTYHDTLRCAQATNYETEACLEYIKRSVTWFNHNYSIIPTEREMELIKNHSCYIAGVNANHEPVIFIDLKGLDTKMNEFSSVFSLLMFLTRTKMHLRGYIETNVLVFNLRDLSSFAIGKLVKLVFDILERSFYGFTSKIYFFQAGTSMKYLINTHSNSLHPVTKQVVEIVSKLNEAQVINTIEAHNLPKELGGDYEKTGIPWPGANWDKTVDRITLDRMRRKKVQPFYFCEEVYKSEWEACNDDDDLLTVFSETNVMARRLHASRRKAVEVEKEKSGFKSFIDRILSLNCCGARSKD